ncbi:hypothetical protein CA13_27430 [Planctomycetes bacterium CA13]|uniref:Uncharacterized protein n=1 Tax=Novipirellula herctigrandis TaxID=2527986 RepID=A0A5C5Z1N0_9BACT|nr:hypothetical protein CA13_27430 [Planctomycetes bacterium CA13]
MCSPKWAHNAYIRLDRFNQSLQGQQIASLRPLPRLFAVTTGAIDTGCHVWIVAAGTASVGGFFCPRSLSVSDVH